MICSLRKVASSLNLQCLYLHRVWLTQNFPLLFWSYIGGNIKYHQCPGSEVNELQGETEQSPVSTGQTKHLIWLPFLCKEVWTDSPSHPFVLLGGVCMHVCMYLLFLWICGWEYFPEWAWRMLVVGGRTGRGAGRQSIIASCLQSTQCQEVLKS